MKNRNEISFRNTNTIFPLLTLTFIILCIVALCLSNFGAGCAAFIGYLITGAAWMYQEAKIAPLIKE